MTPSEPDNAAQAHEMALQGASLYQRGQARQAREICLQALRLTPRSFEVLLLLAFMSLRSEQLLEAIEWIERAIAENPHSADAYFLRGEAQQKARHYEAAAASYDEVLRLKPDHADALNNRGNAFHALGLHQRALDSYDRALELAPAKGSFHSNRGLALKALGLNSLAIESYQQAIALQNDYGLAYFNLGLSMFEAARYAEAASLHDEAIRLMPGHAPSHWGRADALRASGQYEDALASYDTAVSLAPDDADIHNNRGLLLHFWGKHHDALTDFATATRLDPAHADAHCNHGMTLEALGQHSNALDHYDEAIAHSPGHAAAHFNRALGNLTLGNYRRGWQEYEWRWQTDQLKSARLISDKPLWLGQPSLRGQRILVHAEQGLGDSLQFCRYLPMLLELDATLIVQVQAPLVPLLRRMRGIAEVIAQGDPLPEFDVHCPFMSLPLAFGTTLATVPSPQRYLWPSPQKSQAWQRRAGTSHLPRIGLVWAGAAHASLAIQRPVDVRRSIRLAKFASLSTSDATFFSLQKGEPAAAELRALERERWNGPKIVDYSADLHDFDDTAALIDQLDLVISVDTSVAHLAGALGKPVWLLNRFDTCWRWMTQPDDSPWYSSMKIFRQPTAGDWDTVIADVQAELQRWLADGSRNL